MQLPSGALLAYHPAVSPELLGTYPLVHPLYTPCAYGTITLTLAWRPPAALGGLPNNLAGFLIRSARTSGSTSPRLGDSLGLGLEVDSRAELAQGWCNKWQGRGSPASVQEAKCRPHNSAMPDPPLIAGMSGLLNWGMCALSERTRMRSNERSWQ